MNPLGHLRFTLFFVGNLENDVLHREPDGGILGFDLERKVIH
jgi:hypothetical protein